jgi:uncharacterized membrane protein YphA (DoxX/SURF4 family)
MPSWRDELVKLRDYLPPLGRLLLSGLFVWSGYGKLMDPAGNAQFIASEGIPGFSMWWPSAPARSASITGCEPPKRAPHQN